MSLTFARVLMASLALVAAAACSSRPKTRVSEIDVEPGAIGPKLEAVLVVAMTNDEKLRVTFEERMVDELEGEGVRARSSAEVLASGGTSSDQMREVIEAGQFDGVLIALFAGTTTRDAVVTAPMAGFDGSLYDHYRQRWPRSYVVTEKFTAVETWVYRAEGGGRELAWTARTETEKTGSREKIVGSIADKLRARLRQAGLI